MKKVYLINLLFFFFFAANAQINIEKPNIAVSTYLGGSIGQSSRSMQVIGNEVHILGQTQSTNYPVTNGSTLGGNQDIVYTKLNASTGAIITSTYLGGGVKIDQLPCRSSATRCI